MPPERILISDGIYLNIINCDKFKTNYISVDFLCNLNPETTANFALLPFVLARGTKNLPDMVTLTKALDMLYGSRIYPTVSKTGDVQTFGFMSCPLRSEYAGGNDLSLEILKLIGEMINSPYLENGFLSKEYTEREKNIMIDRIKAQVNDKNHYSVLRCREVISEGEAYAIPETGTEDQVAIITEKSLTDSLNRAKNTLRIEIYCVGIFNKEKLTALVKEIFVTSNRKKPAPLVSERSGCKDKVKRVTETQPVKQGKLCLGFKTGCYAGENTLPAYTMFTEILSGSPISKLFMNVREKRSLCYYCSALSDINKGIMIIASGINVKDKDSAEQAIINEIEQCRLGIISDSELQAAKKSITNAVKSMYDDAGAIKSWYLKRGTFGQAVEPFKFLEKVLSVTVDDVRSIARGITLDTVYFLQGTETDSEESELYE